ncbi:hypothetical protein H2200_003395 [Cladophialophora chaetospira]|uniref:Uncharacterized protein n=1 Tax=Cladophialophora chaetospira TaxID=386627 RepID=A0AA38XH94_9EURO|nr:hypothetical protein H2200_003395 [Cladophialophora chaetospira]
MAVSRIVLHGCCQVIAVLLAASIVMIFGLLSKFPIYVPDYATQYDVKNAQQIVNLLTIIVAATLGFYLQYCLGLTNKAEAAADLKRKHLTVPRLRVHAQARSVGDLLTSLRVKGVLGLVTFYIIALLVLSGVSTVLSTIFVLSIVRPNKGLTMEPESILLSADVPPELDDCAVRLSEGTCTYDLAATALSSQLITHTPFTMAGVTFEAPNGTFGIPYGVLTHFAQVANQSIFGNEMRQYCVPVLNKKLVACSQDETRVYYDPQPLYLSSGPIYPITIDPNSNVPGQENHTRLEFRLLTGNGTFVMVQSHVPGDTQTTVIAALGEYAKVISSLTGQPASSGGPLGRQQFTAACTMADVTKPGSSTWKWTSLTLDNGVMKAHVTDDDCTVDAQDELGYPSTGFTNLPYAFEATTRLLGGLDGYSKLINYDSFSTVFSKLSLDDAKAYAAGADMNLLESLLSQMLGIVHTSWTAIVPESQVQYQKKVLQRKFPHHYVIQTFWTPATIIAIVVAALVFLATTWQAVRWALAVHVLHKTKRRWNLLDPEHLIDYTLLAAEELRYSPLYVADAQQKRNATKFPDYPRPEKVAQDDSLTTVQSPKTGTVEQKENVAVVVNDDTISPASTTASS